MKQKLLFIIPSLDSGGGEKSLINLLNTLDYTKYEVELMLFKKRGLFLNLLPNQVVVNEISGEYIHFSKNSLASVVYFLGRFKFKSAFNRIVFTLKNQFIKNNAIAEQSSWKNKQNSIPNSNQIYDVAVAFLEKSSIYYLIDKVNAKKKIGWIHTNYSSSGLDSKFDANYFSQLNYLVTVSPECKQSLIDNFPKLATKIKVIHNIVSAKTVQELADEILNDSSYKSDENTIITVARLSQEKGIDIAINACKELVKTNPNVSWYVIGEGNQRSNLEQLIIDFNLQNNFFLLGVKANPYPYIKQATIYVQPSRYEGKSIAIDEAKILGKPIVVTNFTTAKDQINHSINGIISNANPIHLAQDIHSVLNDKNLQNKLSLSLKNEVHDNSNEEIAKFYSLINE
jgi:glycosyltransferase involved in cell wall biosynthesis